MSTPMRDLDDHGLLLTCSHHRLGWWAECECGWISRSRWTEADALEAHGHHVARLAIRP